MLRFSNGLDSQQKASVVPVAVCPSLEGLHTIVFSFHQGGGDRVAPVVRDLLSPSGEGEGGVLYPMLSDTGGKIGSLYGVYDEEKAVDVRGRFLIDPDGVIQAMEILVPAVGRNVAEVISQLEAFQQHQATGELMPSGWQPGRPTEPPESETLRMVGKL